MNGKIMRLLTSLAVLVGAALSIPVYNPKLILPKFLKDNKQVAPSEGFRLIAISDNQPAFWVPQSVIDALTLGDLSFIDLTDFQDADPSSAPTVAIPTNPTHQSVINPLLSQIKISNFERDLTEFTSFRNRYYTADTGVESSSWVFDYVSRIAGNRSDITVSRFAHSFKQPSVIAVIRGTASSREKVIIGAHQDSISFNMPTGTAPGADDDGSGSMGILEIFRVIVNNNFKPENDIEFHWYAAEEVGLLGSQDVAKSYNGKGVPVRGMIQLDMIGYAVLESTVGVVTDYTDSTLNAFVRKLVDNYLQISWTNTVCGYGCSDHASWDRYGYPASFPFEAQFRNRNPLIHTPNDTMDKVSLPHAQQFIQLGLSFIVELSYK